MRVPRLLTKPIGVTAAAAMTGATVAAVSLTAAAPASACGSLPPNPNRPISADAPFDTPARNAAMARFPVIPARAGTDYGHLPRWKKYSGGRALLREDRVTLRRLPGPAVEYTNTNPLIRSYWLDRDAAILVGATNYRRMTGRNAPATLARVSRAQFLDSFDTRSNAFDRMVKYRSTYRLTFDASHTHIRKIEEVPILFSC